MSTVIAPRLAGVSASGPLRAPASGRGKAEHLVLAAAGQRVIEVGCGEGELTRQLMDREQVVALDPAPLRIARLLGEFGSLGNFQAFSMEATSPRFRTLWEYRPDTVVCVNGLERAEDDRRALFHMGSVLGCGGRVVVLAHACPKLFGPLDLAAGFRRRYSAESLRGMAEQMGLRTIALEHVDLTGLLPTWWRSRLPRGLGWPRRTIAGGILAPLLSRVENRLGLPFGHSLFGVFERTAG